MANQRPPRREGQGSGPGKGHGPARGARPAGPARGKRPHAPAPHRAPPKPQAPSRARAQERPEATAGSLQRLQKVLAHAGIGSRRGCEELILQGRVTVDGQVVRELGTRVDPACQKVAVDGQRIHAERIVYYAVCKPKGYVSTNDDPAGRPRVIDILPEIPERVYSIGRLDEMSMGLMLLTNDGELANRLAHPRYGVEKLYRVIVAGTPDRSVLTKLTDGVWLAEGKVRAKRVRVVGTKGQATVLEMTLADGKNREVRRMLANLGHKVMSLTRIAIGPITLKGLAPGGYRALTAVEVGLLRKVAAGISVTPSRAHDRPQFPPRRGAARAQPPGAPASRRPEGGPPPSRSTESQTQAPRGPRRAPAGPAASSGRRPPRPSGLPPSQRPAVARPRPPLPRPESDEPRRRIIGLDPAAASASAGPSGPRPRRPFTKNRPPPRASLGPRRPRPAKDQGE
jgi:23S rRNA pseudouridine2605 synthase